MKPYLPTTEDRKFKEVYRETHMHADFTIERTIDGQVPQLLRIQNCISTIVTHFPDDCSQYRQWWEHVTFMIGAHNIYGINQEQVDRLEKWWSNAPWH
jgi:hypothetical protein